MVKGVGDETMVVGKVEGKVVRKIGGLGKLGVKVKFGEWHEWGMCSHMTLYTCGKDICTEASACWHSPLWGSWPCKNDRCHFGYFDAASFKRYMTAPTNGRPRYVY